MGVWIVMALNERRAWELEGMMNCWIRCLEMEGYGMSMMKTWVTRLV